MNKKAIIILLIAIIIIGGAVYFLRQPKSGQNIAPNTPSASTGDSLPQSSTDNTKVSSQNYNIVIENFLFNPAELDIKKGDTVIWTNQDSAPHNILESATQSSKISFQSEILSKGQNFSFTFNDAGTFNYICGIHPYMKGKIVVK